MRKAMAEAEVGDDVYGEDPTVRRLEDQVAELLGTDAALFVPSGTMANQIALRAQSRHGDEVIVGKDAHIWRYESGALAALAGLQAHLMPAPMFTAAEVRAAYKAGGDVHASPSRIVAIENTHNMSGGLCWDRRQLDEILEATHALGMVAHLDGARLWNAAIAGNTTEKELARGFDSISVCLSKGLGAPVGSLIAGSRQLIRSSQRLRKMYGGGMRQVGILAAAGIHALDHHRARLRDDHANARALVEALAGARNVRVDPARVETNIAMIDLERGTAAALLDKARERGVLLGSPAPQRIRAVAHLDVDRAAVLRAAEVITEIAGSLAA
jgi:threonine aldolase